MKTAVLVSYWFPPADAVGALRVGKTACLLSQCHGWKVEAVVSRTVKAGEDANGGTGSLPPSLRVNGVGNVGVCQLAQRLISWWRSHKDTPGSSSPESLKERRPDARRGLLARLSDFLAVPDMNVDWIWPAYRVALARLRHAGSQSVLVSSGPPQSAHVAAALAKRKTGRPWIADLRDPWTENPFERDLAPMAERWNRYLERWSLSRAEVILSNTEPVRRFLQEQFPEKAERVITLPNGFDDEDFELIQPKPAWPATERPVLVYAGNLYGRREPSAFLDALAMMQRQHPERCPQVVFLGSWTPEIREHGAAVIRRGMLEERVSLVEPVPRQDAMAALAAADGLLLLGDSAPQMLQIPAKLFEYLRLQKPILSLYPAGSPVYPYLEQYAPLFAGASPDDPAAIFEALRAFCGKCRERSVPQRPIDELSRRHQVARLNDILESCLQQQ